MAVSETPFTDLVRGKEGAEQHFDEPQYVNNVFQKRDAKPIKTKVDALANLVYSWRELSKNEVENWADIEHLRANIKLLRDEATFHSYSLNPQMSDVPKQGSSISLQRPKTIQRGLKLLTGYDEAEINELASKQIKAYKDCQAYDKT